MKKLIALSVLLIMSYACYSQNNNTNQSDIISQYEENIIGEWVLENDSNTRYVFTNNGEVHIYQGNSLEEIAIYAIAYECGSLNDGSLNVFLSIESSNQSIFCSYLETLDYEGQGKMTLITANQGKVIVFLKQ